MRRKKNQLPSGRIRIRVYDSDTGKYKSFTGATKAEAEAKANEWRQGRRCLDENITIAGACEGYIDIKKGVLSPSTITGYQTALRRVQRYPIARAAINDVKTIELQRFISQMAKDVSPKSVANTYGLVSAALKMYLPNADFNITLPSKQKVKLYIPTAADVQKLLDSCDTPELKLAILFAAVGTMRRGEACAVTFSDIDKTRCAINVDKAYVKVDNSKWEIKSTKTYESTRVIQMPEDVILLISSLDRKLGPVLGMNPDQLYDRFCQALNRSGLPHFRYHDLRHFAASQLHAAGVPERYIEAMGGWKPGSNVLKRVYENVMDDELLRLRAEYLDAHRFRLG